jgi:uncharacterized protein YggU (UPF0235/DUF167 family)
MELSGYESRLPQWMGKANTALIEFLKKETHTNWEIISGFTSSYKLLKQEKSKLSEL